MRASNFRDARSVRAKVSLKNKGIFEWDIIIEGHCLWSSVGVCASENFNYEIWAGKQPTEWVLGSNGYCYNSNSEFYYCSSFGGGTE